MTEIEYDGPVSLVSHTNTTAEGEEEYWATTNSPLELSVQKAEEADSGISIYDIENDIELSLDDIDRMMISLRLIREKAEELRGGRAN